MQVVLSSPEKYSKTLKTVRVKKKVECEDRKLIVADGSPLEVFGKMTVTVQIGKTAVEHEIIGADIVQIQAYLVSIS